ncbi:hypothetical protein SAMN05216327_11049 [Dyadobacter sp. SG02]|uniref:hypothetical protein n=1 Tax=Dyadobacter sp. SG02 TaxID=1855291 RepID=UPI0008B8A86A|nr:hypothetical protein [Dyadobacter sp. SG02]SEJ43049.1 hypothetical protein SAMN05216327_11049 [Dyadobacter sp. SG02]
MKTIYYLLALILLGTHSTFGQTLPETFTNPACLNCTPSGYTILSGAPAVSNRFTYGGNLPNWSVPIPSPPSKTAAVFPNTDEVFVTLKSNGTQSDKIRVSAGGLVPGYEYTISYYVLSSSTQFSSFGSTATLQISTKDQFPAIVETQLTTFNGNHNQWLLEKLTFTAPAPELNITLFGTSPNGQNGYVNFDIYSRPFSCRIKGGKVALIRTSDVTPFSCATINLNDQVQLPTPTGTQVIWKKNPDINYATMTAQEVAEAPTQIPGAQYYAFYKGVNIPYECYNTEFSTAAFSFTAAETQAVLTSNSAAINCSNQNTFDLTSRESQSPYQVRWFNNDQHQGSVITNAAQAPLGTYYAFYFNPNGNCYSTNKALLSSGFSVIGATICCNNPNSPASQITLTGSVADVVCPTQTANLTNFLPKPLSLPPNTVIEWFTSPDHTTGKVDDPTAVTSGTYYAFAHDLTYGCYNTTISQSFVNVTTPCAAPELTPTLEIDGLSFMENAERDFVVNIHEIAGFSTKGNVSIRISKIGAFDITYSTSSGTSNVSGGINNTNGNWTFSEDPNFITISSNAILPANTQAVLGFKIKRKVNKPTGITQNLTAVVVSGSGGEKNVHNNTVVTAVSTN